MKSDRMSVRSQVGVERVDPVTTGIKNDSSTQPKNFLEAQKSITALYKMFILSLVATIVWCSRNGG